ncbi:serine/threonine protein kinase [Paenibacillus oryzae]|uniref:Serine/threonine-protein kinase PrkC n=1 Tax=Paenibacillus oryzae TaxID=1844972 RepID=A0A1A5YGT8_9BACL|nr:Stk1 family PASTA domain-containing Ser/Thr kinase [Paenibacillus oryzae]OBR64866.1 serine/threonine protein kinase [Paenibacillus oryzae]
MIGHDLGGRYEILSRVGGGGMALVYKAHDVLLNRNVAVKVLRQQFVNDEEFIRRFRREAQSAAALSHPNVVSIYDVGQEDDTHYIVMEYVEGHNLNEIIQERAPLQVQEAVRIAAQICDALDHAHQNHIIHRDIKPHNILIGNNGRVKVTDFGIARAVTSSTITHTGSVVGSVHYFSPEHAKGINTGEKSDLYSLGIVIYQMLTAKLPFLGESPISVALKHLQESFEDPRLVNPHIPQSVENIILKAMRKNPAERYATARDMQEDLDTCLLEERLNEPPIVFQTFNDLDETKVMPAIRSDEPMYRPENKQQDIRSSGGNKPSGAGAAVSPAEASPQRSSWRKPLIVAGITLVLLFLLIMGFRWLLKQLDTEEVKIPYVVGITETEAREKLEAEGLRVEDPVTREFSKDIPKDIVMEQSKKNMNAKKGTTIQLTVSDGPELKELKQYVGRLLQEAKDELTGLGISEDRIKVKQEFSEEEPGTILSQSPERGEMINPETDEINFVVSQGREQVKMPDLIDMKLSNARTLLSSLELVLEESDISYVPSYLHKKDHITLQEVGDKEILPGEMVAKGTNVKLKVSTGLPADAISYVFTVRISPAVSGKSSKVQILYSDATGENIDAGTQTISGTVDIPVTVIMAPDTVARVSVLRDGNFMDIKEIRYEDALSGNHSPGLEIPGQEPPPQTEEPSQEEEQPAQAEVNGDNDENGSEQGNGNEG